ncbi:hypothetical protein RUM43_009414 [Polyplax serrata]|uniref:Uncharacterized protein n=1 Tax=Polyplax serrata TaxID=468196 RepID=A0AAN8NW31_POLSC
MLYNVVQPQRSDIGKKYGKQDQGHRYSDHIGDKRKVSGNSVTSVLAIEKGEAVAQSSEESEKSNDEKKYCDFIGGKGKTHQEKRSDRIRGNKKSRSEKGKLVRSDPEDHKKRVRGRETVRSDL